MTSIIIRSFGLIAQILTAYRLISILSIQQYGKYAVYIFEINLVAIFLSFGVLSFNINNLLTGQTKTFYKNNAQIILFSAQLILLPIIYFIIKYNSILIIILIIITIFFKILQNICYAGVLGEKGIKLYNIYLNLQLVLYMLITFIPNITIENLILAWLVLTALNVFFLRKYVINSFRSMRFIDLDFKDF